MKYIIVPEKKPDFKISKFIHSVFFEYFGKVIFDVLWVGIDSVIPIIEGIR